MATKVIFFHPNVSDFLYIRSKVKTFSEEEPSDAVG